MAMIEVRNLRKTYGNLEVLRDISFRVEKGEVVVVLGPSGSGKSTMLRCINLLEEFEGGEIRIAGEPIGYVEDAKGGRRRAPCAPTSAWCSSTSICGRTCRCWRT